MATDPHIHHVEKVIGYTFKCTDYLVQALTAAGVDDQNNHDGNRKMAQLGESLIETVIFDNAFATGASRGEASMRVSKSGSRKNRANAANLRGIDSCIKCSPRQDGQPPSPAVLTLAVSAIVGASWLDSGKDINVVSRVIERLGIAEQPQACIDPTKILLGQQNLPSINSPSSSMRSYEGASPFAIHQGRLPEPLFNNLGSDADKQTDSAQHGITESDIGDSAEHTYDGDIFDEVPPFQRVTDSQIRESAKSRKKRSRVSTQQRYSQRDTSVQDRTQEQDNDETSLEILISRERQKLERLSLQGPSTFLLTQESISNIGADAYKRVLRIFFFAVASYKSLVSLQDILRACRDKKVPDVYEPAQSLSMLKRLELIERLDSNIGYLSLLRRCHILKLFKDNRDSSHQTSYGFIIETQASVSAKTKRRAGNPQNLSNATITRSMIHAMFPQLQYESAEYNKKHRYFSEIRKLGQRLHLLATVFDDGILGILPPAAGFTLCITDNVFLKLPEDIFSRFVELLDKFQGNVLRQFSVAAEPIVDHIFHGTVHLASPFIIEYTHQRQILEQPKGSPELLKVLTQGATPPALNAGSLG